MIFLRCLTQGMAICNVRDSAHNDIPSPKYVGAVCSPEKV